VRLPDDPWISTIPTTFAGKIWVGTLSEGLFAVTEAGVQQRVSVPSPTTPAVGDGRLYVGTAEFGGDDSDDGGGGDDAGGGDDDSDGSEDSAGGGAVVALDGTGTRVWRKQTRGFPESQVRYRDGTVFVGTTSGVVSGVASGDGSRRWRAFERPVELPTPVVGPASVYCGARDDRLGGYRATDGTSHLWTVSYERAVPGTPAVSGEVAHTPPSEFLDPPGGRLTRTATPDPDATPTPHVDAPSPEPTWRIDLDGPVEDVGYGDAGAYLGSGSVVVALRSTGDVRWRVGVGGPVRSAPAVGDDTVYVTTTDGAVAALAPGDGTKRWRKSVGERASTAVFADCGDTNLLLVGTESALVALAPSDGTEQWRVETAGLRGSPAVTEKAAVVGDTAGVVRGISLPGGTERWRYEADGAIHGAPAIADGVAYVGTRARRLLALGVGDGSVRWRVRLADWIDSSPVVGHGAVFVVDQSGTLSAVVGDE
ncbi:MAG: PQQ-binding-like beta-propeller repeat protein, partial [Halobaculum sp.]